MDTGHTENNTCTVGQLIKTARSYLGVRYRHQGVSRHGLDCWGLVRATCTELKLLPNDFNVSQDYSRISDGQLAIRARELCGPAIPEAIAGCLVLISWPGLKCPGHLAFFTGVNLIHAFSRENKVVEHGFRAPWPKLVHSYWKIPGVKYSG